MDRIIVAGSLNPDKDCQDRVRVLFRGGVFVNHSERQITRILRKWW